MPFMDGFEASQAIREFLWKNRIKQPIITAVTGQTEHSFIERCLPSGMN